LGVKRRRKRGPGSGFGERGPGMAVAHGGKKTPTPTEKEGGGLPRPGLHGADQGGSRNFAAGGEKGEGRLIPSIKKKRGKKRGKKNFADSALFMPF